jgi:hypothetical protein
VARSSYWPGATFSNRNVPVPSAVVDCTTDDVAPEMLTNSTVAFASTAPV